MRVNIDYINTHESHAYQLLDFNISFEKDIVQDQRNAFKKADIYSLQKSFTFEPLTNDLML